VTNSLTTCDFITYGQTGAIPPIYRQLKSLFDTIPEQELLDALKAYYAGRNGYTLQVLWRTYVAMTVLNLPSFASLIRTLENNPFIALACGITSKEGIPSKFAYSRFMGKFTGRDSVALVKNIMNKLTLKCYETFPRFGKSVAIDATDLKAWANGGKHKKSDIDAGWVVKADTAGKRKYVYGYKMHLMVDTEYEIPITAGITKGNTNDVSYASRTLRQARFINSKFRPQYVICDAGYSSAELRHLINRQYRATPIIKPNKSHVKWLGDVTPEWQEIYNRRTSVERVFGRMKTQRRLNNITVRRRWKVTAHSLIPVIVTQAMALTSPESPRDCVL
jgi:transposase